MFFFVILLSVNHCLGIRESMYTLTKVREEICIQEPKETVAAETIIKCMMICSGDSICRRIMYCKNDLKCELHHSGEDCIAKIGKGCHCQCYRKLFTCENGNCLCPVGYYGDTCQHVIKDCHDGFNKSINSMYGLAYIQPSSNQAPFEIWCNFDTGLTHLAYRRSNCLSVNFNRSYTEYVNGFGYPQSEYWIGLERMKHFLDLSKQNLKFSLYFRNVGGPTEYKYYEVTYYNVRLSDASTGYKIFIDSSNANGNRKLEALLGTVNINTSRFSTYDMDYTNNNCPKTFGGGWWFSESNSKCSASNLFGLRHEMFWVKNNDYDQLFKFYLLANR